MSNRLTYCCDIPYRKENREVMVHQNVLYTLVYSFPSEQIREACYSSCRLVDAGDSTVVTISIDFLKVWVQSKVDEISS